MFLWNTSHYLLGLLGANKVAILCSNNSFLNLLASHGEEMSLDSVTEETQSGAFAFYLWKYYGEEMCSIDSSEEWRDSVT